MLKANYDQVCKLMQNHEIKCQKAPLRRRPCLAAFGGACGAADDGCTAVFCYVTLPDNAAF
jgi:hypothetical protein